MRKYIIALALVLAFLFTSDTFAQVNRQILQKPVPIPPVINSLRSLPGGSIPSRVPTTFTGPTREPVSGTVSGPVSATVKGSFFTNRRSAPSAIENSYVIRVAKLVNGRWVQYNNFQAVADSKNEYKVIVKSTGTYRFTPAVTKFDPKVKYTFKPAQQVVVINEKSNNQVYLRNFNVTTSAR